MATKRVADMTPEEHERHLQKRREYRERNKDKINARKREYYHNNLEQMHKKQKEYYEKNKEKIRGYNKKYLDTHPEVREKMKIKDRECRQKRGKEYQTIYMRKYRAENKNNINEKERMYNKQRRIKKLNKLNYKKLTCIYLITNNVNNKVFIGYTTDWYKLKLQSIKCIIGSHKNSNKSLYNDYIKYGEENFSIENVWTITNKITVGQALLITKFYYSIYHEIYNSSNFSKFSKVKYRFNNVK